MPSRVVSTRKRKPGRPPKEDGAEKRTLKRPAIWDKSDRHAVPRDGKHQYLWVTDSGRQEPVVYQQSGWEFVTREMIGNAPIGEGASYEGAPVESNRVVLNVGRAGSAENAMAYLMRCPLDIYEEFREAESEYRNQPLRDIMRKNKQMIEEEGFTGDIKHNIRY